PLLIIALGIGAGVVSRVLSSPPTIILGELSYSIYLVHQIAYRFYALHWLPAGNAPDYGGWALCLAATLLISYLIWRFIETPARLAAKRWARHDRERRDRSVKTDVPPAVAA